MPLLEYAELAARLECDFISVNFAGAANGLGGHPSASLRNEPELRKSLSRRARELGLGISLVEGFAIMPDTAAGDYAADLDATAEMGATTICAVSLDKDLPRSFDRFAALAEAGAERNLVVTTEVGAGVIRNLDTARAALAAVEHENFRLLLDAMHFFRSGGTVQDLLYLDSNAIGHVQLCDVPSRCSFQSYMEEALFERRAPDDGELPLIPFLAAIPDRVPVGLEMPVRSSFERGVPLLETLGAGVSWVREHGEAAPSSRT